MSRYTTTPSHLGRKVIGYAILLALAVIIVIGILQKTTTGEPDAQNDTPSTAVTPAITAPPPSDLPAPPVPPVIVSSCHKPTDAPPPATTEQGFIDLVWEYESGYLSADPAQWEAALTKTATMQYQEQNRRPASQSASTLTTTVIPDGSVITWRDNEAKTERTVTTIACILIKDGEKAITLPYSVPAHHTTWAMTESGWRINRDTH